MDVVMRNFSLQSRYPMRCGGCLSYFDSRHFTHDRASSVHHHGHHNFNPQTWYLHPTGQYTLLLPATLALSPNKVRPSRVVQQGTWRVFCKCSSHLARTSRFPPRFCRNVSDMPLIGREPTKDFPLGS